MIFKRPAMLLTLASCGGIAPVFAAQSPSVAPGSIRKVSETRWGLKQFFEAARDHGDQLKESIGKLEEAESDLLYARSKAYPTGSFESYVAPVPAARGNAVTGYTDYNVWGPVWSTRLEIVQPLYTFGAISSAKEAGEAGVRAYRALYEKDAGTLCMDVARFYFGFQLAFELTDLATDMEKKLTRALEEGETMRHKQKRGAPSATDMDKVRIFLTQATSGREEAQKGMAQARLAMAWKIGSLKNNVLPSWDRANLNAREFELEPLESYLASARLNRPEMLALEADVKAHQKLADVEDGLSKPALFAAFRGEYTVSNHRDNQKSPFAKDDSNVVTGIAAIGLKMDLDFASHSSKKSKARAQAIQSEGRKDHLMSGMMLEIEKAYQDLAQMKADLARKSEAVSAARRIFTDDYVAFEVGNGSAKDMLEAAGQMALMQKAQLESIYNYNVATFELERVSGRLAISRRVADDASK